MPDSQYSLLEAGEKMLWEGRPQRGFMLRSSDAMLIPFSIFFFGFSIFWEFQATNGKAPTFFSLWGIPFIAVGFYLLIGRFLVDAFVRGSTYYGVTDQRVLISSGLWSREVRSLFLAGLPEMRLTQKSNGRGTIKFGADPQSNRIPLSWTGSTVPAFEGIEDVENVYKVILKAQKAAYANQ